MCDVKNSVQDRFENVRLETLHFYLECLNRDVLQVIAYGDTRNADGYCSECDWYWLGDLPESLAMLYEWHLEVMHPVSPIFPSTRAAPRTRRQRRLSKSKRFRSSRIYADYLK